MRARRVRCAARNVVKKSQARRVIANCRLGMILLPLLKDGPYVISDSLTRCVMY